MYMNIENNNNKISKLLHTKNRYTINYTQTENFYFLLDSKCKW